MTFSPRVDSIVFDLDGTLYFSEEHSNAIREAAAVYMAEVLGVESEESGKILTAMRKRFDEEGRVGTLSAVCVELGGDIRELNYFLEKTLIPEAVILPDPMVRKLVLELARRFTLYIYTNNTIGLAGRILSHLGITEAFRRVFTVEERWRPKPDMEMLDDVMIAVASPPGKTLFVGDRYDVDLLLPESKGSPVYLCRTAEQLLRLEKLLIR